MHESPVQKVMKYVADGKSRDEIMAAMVADGTKRELAQQLVNIFMPKPGETPPNTPPVPPPPAPSTTAAARPAAGSSPVAPGTIMPPAHSGKFTLKNWQRSLPHGWMGVILVCMIPIVAILVDEPLGQRFGNLSLTSLTVGDMTGVVGLILYALALLLSTRMRWIEKLFGGLNRVFISHHILGGLALIMVLVHPVTTSLSYASYGLHTVAKFFVPQLAYLGSAFGIIALVLMVALLMVTFFIKLGYKLWLSTHKYLGVVFLLIGLHVVLTPNHITGDPFVHWYLLAVVLVGIGAYVYRTLLPNVFVRRYLYSVQAATPKATGVIEVTLAPINKVVEVRPGQFVFISFSTDGLSTEWHPFTVSAPEHDGVITIDVKSLGAYTETLTRLLPDMVGMTAHIEGAYGRFSYRNFGNTNQIWIAGGIGITPFLSMAQALGEGPFNIDLYYSVRTESELIDIDKLAAEQSNTPGRVFRVFPYVADNYHSHLSAQLIANTSGSLAGRDFLVCGPPPMMHSIIKQLLDLKVSQSQIHSEEFSL